MDWKPSYCEELPSASIGRRVLHVNDGQAAHAVELPQETTIGAALRHYAGQYDAPGGQAASVYWRLWEDGIEVNRGAWRFVVGS
jgi:hypothetical protein